MNNEPIYIIINLDGVRINIRLQSGATLLPLVPKMTGSWRLAKCTSPIMTNAKIIVLHRSHGTKVVLQANEDALGMWRATVTAQ